MGRDKALLPVRGVPMIEIALEKLRTFCAAVSISGNRDDLAGYSNVVHETRMDAGPAAGIEAGLRAARQPWALFLPVDVPLVPADLLRRWCEEALRVNMTVSFLGVSQKQPAFCLLRRVRSESFTRMLDEGERRLEVLLNRTAETDDVASWMYDAYDLYGYPDYQGPDGQTLQKWFANLNTPEEFAAAERDRNTSSRLKY
jgi:molybdopterin-guanine dinucleotide biosynthesis protein A